MLIGIDANEANLTPNRVGINQYAYGVLKALWNLKAPHEFIIYLKTPPLPDLPPARSGWTYRVLSFPKFWTQTRLPWDLYRHRPRPDVFLSLTHYAPRWSPMPIVVEIMDLGFLKDPGQFTPRDFNQLKTWTAYSVSRAAKIITISRHTKSDIISTYHRSPADIAVTYPGFDPRLYFPHHQPGVLKKYHLREPYFLFVSSLKPSKNLTGLISAFSEFPDSGYSLVIVGKKAWLYEDIFALVAKMHLENRVIFTGFIPEADKPALMSRAAAFVLPSFYEGFGIPVLEAMACGVPVVVSRVASLPEVAGDAGIYVDPHSSTSITAGLTTAVGTARSQFVARGLARVKLFSWAKTARVTLSVLESLSA